MERVAEYYYATGDAKAKALLDKWVTWAIANTTIAANGDFTDPGHPVLDRRSRTPGTRPARRPTPACT